MATNYVGRFFPQGPRFDPTKWSIKQDLDPRRFHWADFVKGTPEAITGFIDQGSDGVDADFTGGSAILLAGACNGKDAVSPVQPYEFANQDKVALTNDQTPWWRLDIRSMTDWRVNSGGSGSADFWTTNEGPSIFGQHLVALDPVQWPGNNKLIVFVGDDHTPYVGTDDFEGPEFYGQYFSTLVNYKGPSDPDEELPYGNPANFEIFINSVKANLMQTPIFNDQQNNPFTSFQMSLPDSSQNGFVLNALGTGRIVQGNDLIGLNYFTKNVFNIGI